MFKGCLYIRCTRSYKGNIKGYCKNRTKRKIDGNLNCNSLEIYGEFTGNGEVVELKVFKGGKVKGHYHIILLL